MYQNRRGKRAVERLKSNRNVLKLERGVREKKNYQQLIDVIQRPNDRILNERHEERRVGLRKNVELTPKRKQMLFMNLSDESLDLITKILKDNLTLPSYCRTWPLRLQGNKLFFDDLPMLNSAERHKRVRDCYYNPSLPSTIWSIHKHFQVRFANITRKNVRSSLNRFEVYQRLKARRRPITKVPGTFVVRKPGILSADCFFPSALSGWEERVCLTICDCFSRFSRVYVLQTKEAKIVNLHFKKFLEEYRRFGHPIKMLLTDKGTELSQMSSLLPEGVKHHVSPTGSPIQYVESLQSEYLRRLSMYRLLKAVTDPKDIMWFLSEQINNMPIRCKQNYSPVEIMNLTPIQCLALNNRTYEPVDGYKNLPRLFVGSKVRHILWTFKQQVDSKMKGYLPKWSIKIFTVNKITRRKNNTNLYIYRLKDHKRFFHRHELLLCDTNIDRTVPEFEFNKKIRRDEEQDGDLYEPNWSDLSESD